MVAERLGDTYAIVDASIVSMRPFAQASTPIVRVEDDDLGPIERGSLLVRDGVIEAIGRNIAIPRGVDVLDAASRVVMPGLVDAHTHALFAGNRVADFESIASGKAPALGIRYTVEQTRRCSPAELVEVGALRLGLMVGHGTTTAEVKTGYALTADGEVALLHAMVALDARPGMPHIVPTFCGAHALPPEFDDYESFVNELCDRILPRVRDAGVARFADAFCERGYFSVEQSERFLRSCASAGMRLRLHADELAHSGGSALAARLRCTSADHLNYIDEAEIAALAAAGTIAVVCPATTEYLGLDRYAPARDLIDAGVPVALATDFNPGTSPCPSLQTVAHLARRRLRMSAAETIAGCTVLPSLSLGVQAGVLDRDWPADLIVLDTGDFREFGYYYGANLVSAVAIGGPRRTDAVWERRARVSNQ